MKTILVTLVSLATVLSAYCGKPSERSLSDESPLVVMDPYETVVMRADQVDVPAAIVELIQPRYPYECAMKGIMGRVEVVAVIRADGRIEDARVVRADNRAFASAALAAVEQWTFKPAIKDGAPVAVRVSIPVRFVVPELLAQN